MDLLFILGGVACIVYTTAEFAAAAARRHGSFFSAVDMDSGRELELVVDRRAARAERRSTD